MLTSLLRADTRTPIAERTVMVYSHSSFDGAVSRARANADFFKRPYYVVSTTLGYSVERDKPENEARIWFVAQPATVTVQACRPEDRAMLATPAGQEMLSKVIDMINAPDCGRWRNGKLSDLCLKVGSEECDFCCPLRASLKS
jgi:hypothetical protein